MIKEIRHMGEEELLSLKPQPNVAIISITSPSRKSLNLRGWGTTLKIKFYDLEKPLQNYKMFSETQAKTVIKFLKTIKEETLIVQCEAGISRSAAIAKYAAKKNGLPFPEEYQLYNKYVYNKLLNS